MAEAYGDEIKEAAQTLHIEGFSSREIKERLAQGNAGLPYRVDPAERTIDGWRRKWKREGIRTASLVRAGDEESTADAIYRRLLGLYRQALSKLEDQELKDRVDPALVKRIGQYQAIIDAARVKRSIVSKRNKGERLTETEGAAIADTNGKAEGPSMLEVLARQIEEESQGEPGQTEAKASKDTRVSGILDTN